MKHVGIFTNAFKKDLKLIGKKHPKDVKLIIHSIEHIVFDFDDAHNIVFYAVDYRSSIYDKLRRRFKKC